MLVRGAIGLIRVADHDREAVEIRTPELTFEHVAESRGRQRRDEPEPIAVLRCTVEPLDDGIALMTRFARIGCRFDLFECGVESGDDGFDDHDDSSPET